MDPFRQQQQRLAHPQQQRSTSNTPGPSNAPLPPIHQLHSYITPQQQQQPSFPTNYQQHMPYYPHQNSIHLPQPPLPPPSQQQLSQQPQPAASSSPTADNQEGNDSEDDQMGSGSGPGAGGPSRTTDSGGEPVKKKRRRQALSCTECKRRKIRCDRNHPCGPCTRRSEQDKCKWNVIEPLEKFVTRTEYDALRTSLGRLETMISGIAGAAITSPTAAMLSTSLHHPPGIQYPAPGIAPQRNGHWHTSVPPLIRSPPEPPASSISQASERRGQDQLGIILGSCVPRREVCNRLVDYYFQHLSPSHAIVHSKSFNFAYKLFWDTNNIIAAPTNSGTATFPQNASSNPRHSPPFISLLLIILCLALESIGPDEALHTGLVTLPAGGITAAGLPCNIPPNIEKTIIVGKGNPGKREWSLNCWKLWAGSKAALGLGSSVDGTGAAVEAALGGLLSGQAGLDVVQTLVLYSYCNQNLDQHGYEVQAPTLALAIRVAFNMGLARIPTDKVYHIPEFGILKREICRRMWWTLVYLDWHLSPSLGHTYLVSPSQFSTDLPVNLNYEDLGLEGGRALEPKPMGVFTSVSLLLSKIQVAQRIRELTDQFNSETGIPYEILLEHEGKIQEDAALLPKCLWSPDEEMERRNPQVKWDRLTYTFAKHARTIRLHRQFIILGYRDPRHRHSSEASVSAAEATLDCYEEAKTSNLPGSKWWIINKYCFAAGIVLLIDQFYVDKVDGPSPALVELRRRKIRVVMELLKGIADISDFARRAAILTEHLLVESESPRRLSIGQKRPQSPTQSSTTPRHKRTRTEEGSESRHHPSNAPLQPPTSSQEIYSLSSTLPSTVYTSVEPGKPGHQKYLDYIDAWITATGVELPRSKHQTGVDGTTTPMILGDSEDGFWRRVFDLDFKHMSPTPSTTASSQHTTTSSHHATAQHPTPTSQHRSGSSLLPAPSQPPPFPTPASTATSWYSEPTGSRDGSSSGMGWNGPPPPVVHPMSAPTPWKPTNYESDSDRY